MPASGCRPFRPPALGLEADVTDEQQVAAAVRDAAEALGELRLVVSCAGIGWAERTVGRERAAALACHIAENPILNGETIRLGGALRMPPR